MATQPGLRRSPIRQDAFELSNNEVMRAANIKKTMDILHKKIKFQTYTKKSIKIHLIEIRKAPRGFRLSCQLIHSCDLTLAFSFYLTSLPPHL